MTNTTIVLFCDDFEVADVQWLVDDTEHISSANLILAINASESTLTQIKQKSNCEVIKIEETLLLPALFKAKNIIDSKMYVLVNLICSHRHATSIESLCKELFPPVYTWKVVTTLGSNSNNSPHADNNIASGEIASFLMSLPGDGDICILQSDLIPKDVFYHGFSTRPGGISQVPGLRSLNMVYSTAKHDSSAVITENQRRLAEKSGFDSSGLVIARAIHGNMVRVIGKEIPDNGYDGIVTDKSGITCGASGADCIVMLFADPVKRACGAIHSGWKGTLAQICIEAVHRMKENFGSRAEDLVVVMGPSICEKCLEFGIEDSKQFEELCPKCVIYREGCTKPTIDLKLANRIFLEANGVRPEHIDDKSASLCTIENPELLFSYRRDGRPFGSQIGFIGMK